MITIPGAGDKLSCKSNIGSKINIEEKNAKEIDKLFSCKICGKPFSSLRTLRQHGKMHEEMKFSCNFCEKKYFYSHQLHEHKKNHTGETSVCL